VRAPGDSKSRSALVAIVCGLLSLVLLPTAVAAGTADLAVDTTDNADPVRTGQLLVYTTTLTNRGPDAATAVHLVDTLPPRLDFVSLDASRGTCAHPGRRSVRCTIDHLPSGATARLVVRVRPSREETLTNAVSVDGRETDPQPADNADTEQTTVEDPEPILCAGRRANIVGTEGDDAIAGTDGHDVIAALGGDDAIKGGGGKDIVCGSGGDDAIKGKGGNDELRGGGGDDAIKGGGGADVIRGKGGNDALVGGRGPDVLKGGGGSNTCRGGSGQDSFRSC
jgi:uncharacterized repeat protein (TIGR01451 family)